LATSSWKITVFSPGVGQKTHSLIVVHFWNSVPSYDTKLNFAYFLKRRILVVKKPSYGPQLCHFMGKVTNHGRVRVFIREEKNLFGKNRNLETDF
jgi:hypothetical protein